MKGFSLKGENVKPEKWNPSKVSEILKTDGFWQVLYHQLATEETEEAEEKRRKVFRPRLNRNSIMELSIHNRFLLIRKLSICDSFLNQTAVLHLPGCSRGLWHLSSYSHNSLGDQYQGGTKDIHTTDIKSDWNTLSRVVWPMWRTWASPSTGTPSSWPSPSSFSMATVSLPSTYSYLPPTILTLLRSPHLPDHPPKERGAQTEAEDRPRHHHDCCLCPHGHWTPGS